MHGPTDRRPLEPWQLQVPGRRAELTREADALGRPRLWTDTIGALASATWKAAATAAPDAPFALLSAAGAAVGLPIAPPSSSGGTLVRAERLVRQGGPAYIKLGQFIATANGLLPDPWVEAFAWCRDSAPPLEPGTAEAVIARELGARADGLEVDPSPLAAGSIAQVHRARTADGQQVVVKVRRPRLRRRLRSDIEAFALAAAAAELVHPATRAANLPGFVRLFAGLTLEELDLRLEAQNLLDARRVFAACGLDFVQVPAPLPGMVTERVLVMEHVPGVAYDKALLAYGAEALDGDRLLGLAIRGVLETTLLHGHFHGDLHAGNVLVQPGGRFGLVDFGICGRLTDVERSGLAAFLGAFAADDAAAQVAALRRFGALPADADDVALAADLQAVLDRIASREDGAVTFERLGKVLGADLRVLAAHGFAMPRELVLFFKNLLYLSGFAAAVSPGADLWSEVQRVLAELWAEEPEAVARLLAPA